MSNQTTKRSPLEELASSLISVTEASQISGLSDGYIRKLLRRGKLEGVKIGHNWMTTKEAIRDYLQQERRPGPKPGKK